MRKSKTPYVAMSLVVLGGIGAISNAAITPPLATIYSDSFDGNESGSLGSGPIGGQNLDVANGIDGGTANATWNAATTTVTPITSTGSDAVWQYNNSNTAATISGVLGARDTNLIANAQLPFSPQPGYIYDLEATFQVPAAGTDNHWIGLAFEKGNQTVSGASSALSNDSPTGLVIVRDGDASSTTGYVDIFEGAAGGTGSDTNFNPSAIALTGGSVGTSVTVDEILNTTGASSTISWYLNGISVGSPVTLSGNPTINDVAFGDDTAPTGSVSNFSLTVIPEPATIGLMSLSGIFLLRRRQKAAR
jgi:hypothetical protein